MTEGAVLRRLSAILAADVVGYSRLMAVDEAGTLARFRRLRADVIEPAISRFQGQIVGTAGDSFLVEFTNALAAVECALAWQSAVRSIGAAEAEDRRIAFRMGINLGDVIAQDGTIHGDGVNIAARLEKLAEPGGLCIAQSVLDMVSGKVNVACTDLGEHELKNIARPVRVYRIEFEQGPRIEGLDRNQRRSSAAAERVSIAVLRFDNMSGDPEQTYFSDGITEDIITELSRFRELQVTARNASFQVGGKGIDIGEVAKTLRVQFVVEGSVRKIGNRVRVTVQLIEAASISHVWAERYDRDLTDIFELQDEITRAVVARVAGHAKSSAAKRSRARRPESLSAYDNFLRARELFRDFDVGLQSETFLLKAIELDPGFAMAHAMLADIRVIQYLYSAQKTRLAEALTAARKALDLDPEDPWTNFAFGFSAMFASRLDEAYHYFGRAMELNPHDVYFLGVHANLLRFMGRLEDAVSEIDEAIRRDPYSYNWFWSMRGSILTNTGRYAEAIESFRRTNYLSPWHECYLAVCYAELGQLAQARACLERFRTVIPVTNPEEYMTMMPYADAAVLQHLIDRLRHIADG